MFEPSTILGRVATTAEWLEQVRSRPSEPPVKRKPGRPKGTPNPPPSPKEPRPQPLPERVRLAPHVRTSWDPRIEIPAPEEGLRAVVVTAESMGQAAREGLARAREFWPWLQVQSVAGISQTDDGWRVTVRVVDDGNPYARRRWRIAHMRLGVPAQTDVSELSGTGVAQTQSASTRGPCRIRRPKGAHPSCRVGRASRSCLHPSPLKTLGGLDGSGRRRTRKPSPDHLSGRL